MSNVTVRAFEPRDDEAFRHVRAMTFRGGEGVKPEEKLLRSDCLAYVGELDGEIVAATTVIDMTATLGQHALRCAGLAAVAVLPEHRRSGIGTKLMNDVLPLLRAEGFALASLYPYRGSYYRKFGYEYCGTRYQITCPVNRLPKIKSEPLPVRQLDADDRSQIYSCYETFARRYSGMNLRKSEDQWWRVLGGDTPLQVYAVGNPVEGYIVLRLNSDFWETQPVKEFAWNTRRAYDSLLTFFHSLAINKDNIEWREPGDSPFLTESHDPRVKVQVDRQIMYRIVDLPSVLKSVPTVSEGEFSVAAQDNAIPENNGAWHVCFQPEAVHVEKTSNAKMALSIGQLTQAALGEPSLAELASNNVPCGPQEDIEQATRFFGSRRTYCTDFF